MEKSPIPPPLLPATIDLSALILAGKVKLHPLVLECLANPYRLLTAEEVRSVFGKSINWVMACKKAGAPFPGGVTRPEWLVEWLRTQRPDFVLNTR